MVQSTQNTGESRPVSEVPALACMAGSVPSDPWGLRGQAGRCLELVRCMLELAELDRRQGILVRQGVGGHQISSRGHEGVMAVVQGLRPGDLLFPYYRSSHLLLARGLGVEVLARDFLGKATSTSGGRSVSAHAHSTGLGIFPSSAPTGGQCTPAVGAAWGQQRSGSRGITLCSIGDGATREGEFLEAVGFAVERRLPILFLVEDNGYAISTPTARLTPLALGMLPETALVRADARDIAAFLPVAEQALDRVRRGDGPVILWCRVERLEGHTGNDDPTIYRRQDEVAAMVDPVPGFLEALDRAGVLSGSELESMRMEASERVRRAYAVAREEPEPEPGRILEHLRGAARSPECPPILSEPGLTMVEAVNRVLAAGLAADPRMLMFGQDIEDPKGGVFGFTRGLSRAYPGRVENAPIAEATLIGAAVGLAATGWRPVFELQFVDFITPGFDQLVSQVASLRWRTCGAWRCPMVLYAPYGAYVPSGGLWHSQSNDGWWCHIPGLRVAIPSTAADVAGLFWSAFRDEDPSLILIPKHLFRIRDPHPVLEPIPFGSARVVHEGSDVTVVAWGNTRELAERAAEVLATEDISVEVLDLRTLVPCDWDAIERSLARTGRLVVVHEDHRTCGFGATVLAEMTGDARRFELLLAPPRLVARDDVHIPFHPELEAAVLPSLEDVLTAVRETVGY